MKYLLIFPFFIFAFNTFSQQDFPKNNLIIHMDPGVGNILINFSANTAKSGHKPWFGFAVGLNYERQFNEKHALITGLDLQTISSVYKLEFFFPPNGDSNQVYHSERPGQNYMIAIPLVYAIGKNFSNFRIGGEFGLVNSFGVAFGSSSTITNFFGETNKIEWETYPVSGFIYFLDAKLGVNFTYRFSDNFGLGIAPYARIAIYTPDNSKTFFHNWNVNVALNFKYTFHSK
ncbi:MAG: hypothetical protein R2799_10180 [Crocinitomicaceae bacterium]